MQFQKEIDDLREMHQKSIQRIASESEDRADRTEGSLKTDMKHAAEINERQRDRMTKNYETQLREKDAVTEETMSRAREQQQEGIEHTVKNMDRARSVEVSSLTKDRESRIEDLQRAANTNRYAKDLEIKRLEHQRQSDNQRLTGDARIGIDRERENNRISQETQSENLESKVRTLRGRYEAATDKMRRDTESARDELNDKVGGRQGSHVSVLEAENIRLKEDQVRDRVKTDQAKERELTDLRNNMQANIDSLEIQRRDTVDASNKKNSQEITRINKGNEGTVHETHKFYQDKIAMDGLKTDERLNRQKSDGEKVLSQEKNTSQGRFEKLKNSNDIEQGKMRGYFERASQAMKENFETTLREMRERSGRDQEALFSTFSKQATENDAKFQQKLADVSVKYEKQLAEIQENHLKDFKDQAVVADRQKKELEKKAEIDLKSQASQFEYRIAKNEETQKKLIERLNQKHEETLANLTKSRQS